MCLVGCIVLTNDGDRLRDLVKTVLNVGVP